MSATVAARLSAPAGKYSEEDFLNQSATTGSQGSRKSDLATLGRFSERNFEIVAEVKKVAFEVRKSPAQVALAWSIVGFSRT
jgi:aryl-alcohol dehydrogenase-like predicted oxidoreductase